MPITFNVAITEIRILNQY